MPRPERLARLGSAVDRADGIVVASFVLLATATFVLDRPSDARAVPDLAVAPATGCATEAQGIVVHRAAGPEPGVVRIDVCADGTVGVDVLGSADGIASVVARRIDAGAPGPNGDPEVWQVTDRFAWRRPVAAGESWVVGRVGGEAEARAWIAGTHFEPSR